ncbi:enoyl-CoA hydratase/isomerase family protein [Microbacterium pygmaeum]|uniref:Enoyl-CoA hydratase n=1 Tax=Microbacterium pygmaeum TaxID=370764 RepID=A0A1G7XEB6_9MICO|nr:enoyl-CoA hydratase-related protein [Microbacterium pygmaeum]SDG82496.1 enoyl-CoA hydratase [Microbacterium pygmaeum]
MGELSVLTGRDGHVATVTIDRVDVHNALDAATLAAIEGAVAQLADGGARAIVITGTGTRAFSAGADLNELAGLDAVAAHAVLAAGQRTMSAIAASRVPVIAAVNGLALGGGFELVLSCTFAVLADTAKLGLPESGLGLMPGYGGTQRLPALIGRAAAAHVMLTGTRLDARRCYELGLTPMAPVPLEQLMDTAMTTAHSIAAKGPRAQSAILTALSASAVRDDALSLESALAGVITGGDEAREGIAAFREKRDPRFESMTGASRT